MSIEVTLFFAPFLDRMEGFEPPSNGIEARRSYPLSYIRIAFCLGYLLF